MVTFHTCDLLMLLAAQFLNASKPWAPYMYAGIYAAHWLFFGAIALSFRLKSALSRARAPIPKKKQ